MMLKFFGMNVALPANLTSLSPVAQKEAVLMLGEAGLTEVQIAEFYGISLCDVLLMRRSQAKHEAFGARETGCIADEDPDAPRQRMGKSDVIHLLANAGPDGMSCTQMAAKTGMGVTYLRGLVKRLYEDGTLTQIRPVEGIQGARYGIAAKRQVA